MALIRRMRKEIVITDSEVLNWHFPGGTEKNYKDVSKNSPCPGVNLNQIPREHSARMLMKTLQSLANSLFNKMLRYNTENYK
jgi:hypothetical protein